MLVAHFLFSLCPILHVHYPILRCHKILSAYGHNLINFLNLPFALLKNSLLFLFVSFEFKLVRVIFFYYFKDKILDDVPLKGWIFQGGQTIRDEGSVFLDLVIPIFWAGLFFNG